MADVTITRHVFRPSYIYAAADHQPPGPCAECMAPADAPHHYRTPVELSDVGKQWLQAVRDADTAINAITKTILAPVVERRETAVRNLQAIIGDGEAATVDGRPVVLWAYRKPAAGFDLDALRRDHPEIAAAYAKPKKPARPFAILEVDA